MSFIKVPYDNAKLEAIRVRLENHARISEPIYYAVVIDELEVIPRTTDATLFATIDELIGPTTKYISVSEYIGQTRNRKTTCFVMDAFKGDGHGSLNGIDSSGHNEDQQQYIEKRVAQATLERDYSNLQTEHGKVKLLNDASLDKCDKLEEENSELKKLQNETSQENSFLTLAADLVRSFAPQKPESPLSGTDQKANESAQSSGQDGQMHVAISEDEYKNYKYFTGLFENCDQAQQGLVSKLVELLSEHPDLIEETFVIAFQKSQDDGK